MNKKLFTTALALVLSVGGFAASLQADDNVLELSKSGTYVTKTLELIGEEGMSSAEGLKTKLSQAAEVDGKSVGYLVDKTFVSLDTAMGFQLPVGQPIQFGYGTNAKDFKPRTVTLNVSVTSDPGYYSGYKSDGFFQLDFPEDPFDGTIEIMVMGEPLPASTVTLLVALGAGALLLLYKNRRTRDAEQA